MKEQVSTNKAPAPAGAYSQGIVAGDFVFTAGQGPLDPDTGLVPEGIQAQTHQVLRNIEAILAAAETTLSQVVKVTAHLADLADFASFNSAYREHFPDPMPVRTTVGSKLAGILVEIDVVAYRGQPSSSNVAPNEA